MRALKNDRHTPVWSFYTPLAAARVWIIVQAHPELDGSDLVAPEGRNPAVLVLESGGKKFLGVYSSEQRVQEVFEVLKIPRGQFTHASGSGYQVLKYLFPMDVDSIAMNEGLPDCRYGLDPDLIELLLAKPEPEFPPKRREFGEALADEGLLRRLEPLRKFLSEQAELRAAWIVEEEPPADAPAGQAAYQLGLLMRKPEDDSLMEKAGVMVKALAPVEIEITPALWMGEGEQFKKLVKSHPPFYAAEDFLEK